eukprot:CAMPEP_0195567484 /NCGR_PEP_ID=MMETSP0814-20130614/1680_1 /TAXON_ID=97485 /ORGANISM="Prymnesium parvum, Strain Texoma1" /LENGTH=114 /DNA_ID=CAMNT_0040702689 /DNA_START=108 /DNA_END=450 /DNA_ORIENTATION=+
MHVSPLMLSNWHTPKACPGAQVLVPWQRRTQHATTTLTTTTNGTSTLHVTTPSLSFRLRRLSVVLPSPASPRSVPRQLAARERAARRGGREVVFVQTAERTALPPQMEEHTSEL